MAAPNLNAPTTINGKTTAVNLSATTETTLLTNAASSGKALRVKSITLNNTNVSGTVDVTLRYYSAASAGTAFPWPAITIPVGGAVIPVGSENPLWLEEDRRLTVQASAANYATVVISYEDIS